MRPQIVIPRSRDDAHVVKDLLAAGVLEAACEPSVANHDAVPDERRLVAKPHLQGRVAAPAGAHADKAIEDLEGFDALLA